MSEQPRQIDYAGQIAPILEYGQDVRTKLELLREELIVGLELQVLGKTVWCTLDVQQISPQSWTTSYALTVKEDQTQHPIATVSADVIRSNERSERELELMQAFKMQWGQTAEGLDKRYEDSASQSYRRIGLISWATGMLFGALEPEGVDVVHGQIAVSSSASLLARLKAPDIVRGGYYQTLIRPDPNTRSSDGDFKLYDVCSLIGSHYNRIETPIGLGEIVSSTYRKAN